MGRCEELIACISVSLVFEVSVGRKGGKWEDEGRLKGQNAGLTNVKNA